MLKLHASQCTLNMMVNPEASGKEVKPVIYAEKEKSETLSVPLQSVSFSLLYLSSDLFATCTFMINMLS